MQLTAFHSSGLEWTKIDKIDTFCVLFAHKTQNKTQSTTTYRLLAGGNLATNVCRVLKPS
jgi:hypothetical protein